MTINNNQVLYGLVSFSFVPIVPVICV